MRGLPRSAWCPAGPTAAQVLALGLSAERARIGVRVAARAPGLARRAALLAARVPAVARRAALAAARAPAVALVLAGAGHRAPPWVRVLARAPDSVPAVPAQAPGVAPRSAAVL